VVVDVCIPASIAHDAGLKLVGFVKGAVHGPAKARAGVGVSVKSTVVTLPLLLFAT
jgi:hypothetical protein